MTTAEVVSTSAPAEPTAAVRELGELPRSERREALETLLVAEFKATLLMSADEVLPLDVSYFDLGFTSLRLTETKRRLDALLGRAISANVLFNRPTVGQLLDYLTTDVVPELFADPTSEA